MSGTLAVSAPRSGGSQRADAAIRVTGLVKHIGEDQARAR
jgi:hypothetical protein